MDASLARLCNSCPVPPCFSVGQGVHGEAGHPGGADIRYRGCDWGSDWGHSGPEGLQPQPPTAAAVHRRVPGIESQFPQALGSERVSLLRSLRKVQHQHTSEGVAVVDVKTENGGGDACPSQCGSALPE